MNLLKIHMYKLEKKMCIILRLDVGLKEFRILSDQALLGKQKNKIDIYVPRAS